MLANFSYYLYMRLASGLVSQPISCASVWGKSYFFCGVSWAFLYTPRNSSTRRSTCNVHRNYSNRQKIVTQDPFSSRLGYESLSLSLSLCLSLTILSAICRVMLWIWFPSKDVICKTKPPHVNRTFFWDGEKFLLTFFVWVESKAGVKLLMALLFHDGFTKDGILMDDVHRLFLLLLFPGCCHALLCYEYKIT